MNKQTVIVEKNRKLASVIQDFGFSFANVNKMLRNKDVKVNGRPEKQNVDVFVGDEIAFYFSNGMLNAKYDIVYQDEDVYIIYKHAGIETDGEKGIVKLLDKAIAVHRLDRNTEGLVVFAKNRECEEKLIRAFKIGSIHKLYLAEVVGKMDCKDQIFDAFLIKDADNSRVKIVDKKEKNAVAIKTKITTLKSQNQSSMLKIELFTGKTHQIRAHLAYLGHAIIGDGKYGKNVDNKKFQQNRQKLACFCLKFDNVGIKGLNNKQFERRPEWGVL